MKERAIEDNKNIDYKTLLSINYVDKGDRKGTWGFTVTDNYTIFITSHPHPHSRIAEVQRVQNNETLAEGYIDFDDNGKIRRVSIKPLDSRGTLIQESSEKQEKISEAIKNVIKEKLDKIE